MVGVTSNAACSIALRNAVLKGVPKAMWEPVYGAARSTVMGDFKTLGNRRAEALAQFQHYGVTKEMICELLGVGGVQDLVVEHLVTLRGLLTAIQDGDTTVEQAFAPKQAKASASATGKAAGSANTAAKVEAAGPDLNAALDQTPSEAKGPARTGAAKAPASQTETGKSDAMKPREDPRFTAARLIRAAESVRRLDELDPLEAEAQTLPEPQRSEVLGHLGTIRHHVPEGRVDTENGALFSE